MWRSFFPLVPCLSIVISGCGIAPRPRLDTTDDRTTLASFAAMTSRLSEADREQFFEDCQQLTGVKLLADFHDSEPPPRAEETVRADRMRPLNGMDVVEISAKASALRADVARAARDPFTALASDMAWRFAAALLYAAFAWVLVGWFKRRSKIKAMTAIGLSEPNEREDCR